MSTKTVLPASAASSARRPSGRSTPLFLAITLLPEGRTPALPAFTTDHKHLLVPNEETDNVSYVSLERLAVIGTIALKPGSRPWQAKVIPNTRLAYVTNSRFGGTVEASSKEPSTVSIINLDRLEVVGEIQVGAGANGVTVDQRGRRGYVVNMRSDSVSVIDVARHEVIEEISTGRAPAFGKLTRDLDGRLLVVTNLEDSSVTVIDTATLAVVHTQTVGVPRLNDAFPQWGPGDTTGVAITRDDVAYITNYRSHSIVAMDLASYSTIRLKSPIKFPFFVEIDRDAGLAIFSSGVEKKLAWLDVTTHKWIGVYPNDGSALPCERVGPLNIWMTDPQNHRLTAILPHGISGISADWQRNMVTKFM